MGFWTRVHIYPDSNVSGVHVDSSGWDLGIKMGSIYAHMGPIWSNMGPIFHHLGPCIFCTAETEGAIRARGLGIYGLKSGPKWARWAQKSPYKSHMGPRWNRWAPHWPVKSHMSPRYLLVWVCLLDCQN